MPDRHPITGRFLAHDCEIDCRVACALLCPESEEPGFDPLLWGLDPQEIIDAAGLDRTDG